MRQCSICGVEKAYSEFHKKPTGRDGRSTYCKKCQVEKTKIWRNKNPDQVKKHSLSKYGIDLYIFKNMIEYQSNKCAICFTEFKSTKHTHVDHCHTTGKVRGLLCNLCNHLLGTAKDSVQTLENAIQYLHQNSTEENKWQHWQQRTLFSLPQDQNDGSPAHPRLD